MLIGPCQDATRVIVDYGKSSSLGIGGINDMPEDPANDIGKPGIVPGCQCASCRASRNDLASGIPGDEAEVQLGSVEDVAAHPERTLLLLPHTVPAFSLRKKDWQDVEITKLHPVDFAPNAFGKLVIRKPHKKLITAMAKSFFAKSADFNDLVKGKGRGLIILLHGSPGTGKTLTAGKCSTRLIVLAMLTVVRMPSRRPTKTAIHDNLRRPGDGAERIGTKD